MGRAWRGGRSKRVREAGNREREIDGDERKGIKGGDVGNGEEVISREAAEVVYMSLGEEEIDMQKRRGKR